VIRWQDAGKYLYEINDATHWKNKGPCHTGQKTEHRQQKQQLQTSKIGAREFFVLKTLYNKFLEIITDISY